MSNRAILIGWRQRWNRSLLRFIGRRLRGNLEIEDLAQETYLRLLRARDLESVRNPQAYLLTVASHVVSEWHQRQPPQEMFEAVDAELLVDNAVPEFHLELSQIQLDRALDEIPAMT